MTIPHVLPQPDEIIQDAGHCWSSAFASWDRAQSDLVGSSGIMSRISLDQLHTWFDDAGGLTVSTGHATRAGTRFMSSLGLMRLASVRPSQVTPQFIDETLNFGYIYCAYYRRVREGLQRGHACVIYGVRDDAILVMDPWPGRGLTEYRPNFATRMTTVKIGTPLLADLGSALQGVLDNGRIGMSAADVMSQFE